MEVIIYNAIYILMNMFRTYIVFRYMGILLERNEWNKYHERTAYLIYYLIITGLCLTVNMPVILLIGNLIALSTLSLGYKATVKQRVLSVLLIYLLLIGSENLVALITGHYNANVFTKNNYTSFLGLISVQIISYMLLLILENYKKIKRGSNVSNYHWLAIFFIPLASQYIIIILHLAARLTAFQLFTCIFLLLLINIATFYLYDSIILEMDEKTASMLLLQQNNYYERQFELMKTTLANTRSFHHDLENHLSIIYSLSESRETDKLKEYLSELLEEKNEIYQYTHSGNVVIDSIMNFKLQEAGNKGVCIAAELCVPEELPVKSSDLTVILGNLMDNAIQASIYLNKGDRIVEAAIRYDKSRLIIDIKNRYDNLILYEKGKLVTTKEDKKIHGVGLVNVKTVVERYGGILKLEHSDGVFRASALLFI